MAGAGPVHGVGVPVGVEADQVEGDRGEHLLEVDFVQATVAGVADVADCDGLVDGALDAGAQGVGGLPGCGVLERAGLALGGVHVGGCTVSWRRRVREVVQCSRTGQGPQVVAEKLITMVSVPRWVTGFHEELVCPCGQVACWRSKSMVKLARPNPAPALACGDWSPSRGVISSMPNSVSDLVISAAEG